MSDILLKTVRITDDIKLEVYQQGKRRKYALFNDVDQTKSDKYDISMSDDDVIKEALISYSSKKNKKYIVTQQVYKDPLIKRTYGNGDKSPYYLNNGCKINIQWVGIIPNPDFNIGTYSNLDIAANHSEDAGKPRYLENVTITSTTDDASNSDTLPKSSWSVSPPITDGIIEPEVVKTDYRDTSYVYDKIVTVTLPDGFTENEGKGYLVWTGGGLQYDNKSIPESVEFDMFTIDRNGYGRGGRPNDQIVYFRADNKDSYIVERVIEDFKSKVCQLLGLSIYDYKLTLCDPDTEACSIIEYKSPLESPNKTAQQAAVDDTPPLPTKVTPKLKFTIEGLPEVIEVKAKENLPTFTVWAGSIPKPASQIDDFEDLSELDLEYIEGDFKGEEETGLSLQAWALQDDISNGQEDASSTGPEGAPVDIKPVSSFDALIELAGKCARTLGKNGRVNAENMKKGYTKGIHGLCPQGTQAVLYALTGVKAVGSIGGNADHFSFKNPTSPAGGENKSSFSKTGYYNDKVKITQINGSWKGTYLHKDSKSMWQVGDVIAMGYSGGKNYGHIQVWTGYSWMSDFKQGNSIQQNHVDVNSVALWRLNEKGVEAVRKQNGSVA